MCGVGSSRTTDTARATSTAEIGEVLPPPIGSASSLASRTPGAAKSRKNPSRKTVGRMVTTGRPDHDKACSASEAIVRANNRFAIAYFDDDWTRSVERHLSALFEREVAGGKRRHTFVGDSAGEIADAVNEFLTGSRAPVTIDRALSTVLFTDIVGSTEKAAALGDRRWRDLLDEHD